MSGISSSDDKKPMETLKNDQSDATGQSSVTTDGSDETSTQPKNLSDMPVDVAGLIIGKSEYKQQLILRKVSRSLRALVDTQKPALQTLQVHCYGRSLDIKYDNHLVFYQNVAYDDLAFTLKNPRLQLEEFSVSNFARDEKDIEENCKDIRNVLESLDNQVSVKEIDIKVFSNSCLLAVLPFLKPGVLKKISISFDLGGNGIRVPTRMEKVALLTKMDQVACLAQWKQAEELELHDALDGFPMKYATHFKRFQLRERNHDEEKFIRIRDYLSKLENFEKCILSYGFNYITPGYLYPLLGEPVSSNATGEVFHYPIPDSDYYLEIKKAMYYLPFEIEKKKRETH